MAEMTNPDIATSG